MEKNTYTMKTDARERERHTHKMKVEVEWRKRDSEETFLVKDNCSGLFWSEQDVVKIIGLKQSLQ